MGELHERHSWRKERTKESIFHKINKEHEITKPSKTFFIIPLVLILLIAIPYSIFVNTYRNPTTCVKTELEIKLNQWCNDPSQTLWLGLDSGNLNSWNTRLATYTTYNSGPAIDLGSNTTDTAIALSKNPIPDLSVVSGKLMYLLTTWSKSSSFGSGLTWGFYLTRNGTLPYVNATSGAFTHSQYNPANDPSVSLLVTIGNIDGLNSFNSFLYIQHSSSTSIATQDVGGCGSTGSCYASLSSIAIPSPASTYTNSNIGLNFTGNTEGGNTCNSLGTGPGCSYLEIYSSYIGSNTLPDFKFQSSQYYIGFYFLPGFASHIYYGLEPTNSMRILWNVPVKNPIVPSNTDTGGWFGAIGRALGSTYNTVAGVVGGAVGGVLGPIINLGGGLLTVFISALTQSLGLFVQQLKLFLNIVGGWFGIGNVGDSIINFFIGIGSFFISVIGGGFSILDELATEGNKIITTIINFFSNGLSIFNFVNDFLNSMGGLWNIIVGGWNEFLHWYSIGSMSISYFLVLWYFFGIYQVYLDGIHGLKSWLDMSEMFLLSIFKAGYWFSKESFGIVLTIKQLVAGWV